MSRSPDSASSTDQDTESIRRSGKTGGNPTTRPYAPDGSLLINAAPLILGTMLFPGGGSKERQRRHRFLQKMMAAPVEASTEYRHLIAAGRNAGAVLLHQIRGTLAHQIDPEHKPPTINESVDWVRAKLLNDADLPVTGLDAHLQNFEWHDARDKLRKRGHRIKRPRILGDRSRFRSVSHFWAVLILVEDSDLATGSSDDDWWSRVDFVKYPTRIPMFAAFAEALANHAADIPVRRRDESLLPPGEGWRISVPREKQTKPINITLGRQHAVYM